MMWKVVQRKCVERYCELTNKTTQQLYKVTTACLDYHQNKEEELGSVGELSKVCSQIVLKCLCLARIGRPDIAWSMNKLARAVTKWTRPCNKHAWLVWFLIYITQVNLSNIVMWEIPHNNADCDCFRTLILQEILRTQNGPQKECCAYWEITRLFPQVGFARSKLQFHTVRRNLKLFLLMQVYALMEFPLLIFGIWLLKCYILLSNQP